MFLLILVRLVVSIKWQVILRHHQIEIPFKELLSVVFISMTLGQILPAGLGSDVVRAYKLSRKYGQTADTTATIVIDRLVGMFSLFFVAFLGSIGAYVMAISTELIWWLIAINLLLLIGWNRLHLCTKILEKVLPQNGNRFIRFQEALIRMSRIISDKKKIRIILPSIFGWSLVIQVIRCLVFFCLFVAFGQTINPLYYVIFVPIVFVVTLLPVSIGGLGLREGILVLLFSTVGVPAEVSIGAGLISQALQIAAAIPVLLFWLFEK